VAVRPATVTTPHIENIEESFVHHCSSDEEVQRCSRELLSGDAMAQGMERKLGGGLMGG
jgi:hypothetical protein